MDCVDILTICCQVCNQANVYPKYIAGRMIFVGLLKCWWRLEGMLDITSSSGPSQKTVNLKGMSIAHSHIWFPSSSIVLKVSVC